MKKVLPLFLIFSLLTACGTPTVPTTTTTPTTDQPVQLGLNFIRFFWEDEGTGAVPVSKSKAAQNLNTTTDYVQPDAIFADFQNLGTTSFRQLVKADLSWDTVEPLEGKWNFTAADAVLKTALIQPVVTLFSIQYASPTAPWIKNPAEFQKTVGAEAKTYVETVVQRYAPYVKYWEIGNEMEHWQVADPGAEIPENLKSKVQKPIMSPADGFSPEEQGKFFAEVSEIIRANDPDAVVLMPGMGDINAKTLDTWLTGVIAGGGSDWFDITNYHYYGDWKKLGADRDAFTSKLKELGIDQKPVWLTETGVTSDPTLPIRTNYPNSESTQAADVFRRIVTAWGHGDSAAFWHTYISSTGTQSDWREYGIENADGSKKPSYYAFQLLAQNCLPFTSVQIVTDTATQHIYKVTTAKGDRYVSWGSGSWTVPAGLTQMSSVVPTGSTYTWTTPAATLTLSDTPILLK